MKEDDTAIKTPISGYQYQLAMDVRDYEVDSQGIVNNAVYLHYLEHTRHEFCKEAGVTFLQMQQQGYDPVLRRAEIDYISPLRLSESMLSCLNIRREGARFIFLQDIYKLPELTPVIKSRITLVCLENGKLTRGDYLAEAFKVYLN